MTTSEQAKHIRRAIQLARQARDSGNHPFGALIVVDSEVALELAEEGREVHLGFWT